MDEVNSVLISALNESVATIISFVPRFLTGFIILVVGVIAATVVSRLVSEGLRLVKFDKTIKKYGVPESKKAGEWSSILSEIARWVVIVIFLIPASQVWGLGSFVNLLNTLLFFLPNLFIAVFLLLVGFAVSRIVHNLLLASFTSFSRKSAGTIAMAGRWAVLVFVALIALNQLGIASDLIQILFSGIVAMIALAGGLAFGLGGKEAAKEAIDKLRKKL